MISSLVDDEGMSGPRIWPDVPTEAAARTTDAATAPCRNLLREIRGFLIRAAEAGVEAGCVEAGGGVELGGGVVVVDALGFLSSMSMSSVTQE